MVVWSKDMKIKKSHLRRIIQEEIQRESRFRHEDDARDHRAVYGYGHGDKLKRKREQARQAASDRTAETNWDWMDYVAERVWNEMYGLRSRHGANLEKPMPGYNPQYAGMVLADFTPEQLIDTYGGRPGSDQRLAAIELMKRGVPWSDDKEQGRQIIKNAIASAGQSEPWGNRQYWEDWTIMRANQRRRSQRLPEV